MNDEHVDTVNHSGGKTMKMSKKDQMEAASWRKWSSHKAGGWASIIGVMRELDSMGSAATESELVTYLERGVRKGNITKRVLFGILPEYRPTALVAAAAR